MQGALTHSRLPSVDAKGHRINGNIESRVNINGSTTTITLFNGNSGLGTISFITDANKGARTTTRSHNKPQSNQRYKDTPHSLKTQ